MRSLFLKIFLWFWAAQILIGAALYLLATVTQRGLDERFNRIMGTNLEARARAAAVAYEAGGSAALQQAWSAPATNREPPERGPEETDATSLYELRGASQRATLLVGQPMAVNVAGAPFSGDVATLTAGSGAVLLRRFQTPRGGRYIAAMALRFSNRPNGLLDQWLGNGPGPGAPLRLLVIGLTMGTVCFALARYLTAPAVQLRRATQQFASGDLSARVGAQMRGRRDELADLGRDFDLMAERIEGLMLRQRRLLGDISHELRSPLTRLKLALELAESTATGETRDYLTRIGAEAEELGALISQLLTLERLESTAHGAHPQGDALIDLAHLVRHVGANADFEARSRNSRIEVVEAQPCQIVGNGELLQSAVENVVRNAVWHSPPGSRAQITLRIEPASLVSHAAPAALPGAPSKAAARVAVVRVRDNGPGVPDEALPLLFQPFYRVAEARDRQSGGTGLGLSITQRAVAFHGGSVAAFNAPGGGLLVEIRLPLAA